MKKIGIIGGGIMGLYLAYRLSMRGFQVIVFEGEKQIGGLSTWFNYGDFIWDKYYHVILRSDSHLIRLIEELGLKDKLVWAKTKTGFLWHGKHLSIGNHLEFLRFPALNFIEKIRLGLGILYSTYLCNPEKLEKETAPHWLTSVFGKQIYKTLWEPLLESKFGVLKDKVPASILRSTISRYFSTRSKGAGKEMMGHLFGEGLKPLFDTLHDKITANGGKIYCEARVTKVQECKDTIEVTANGETFLCDRLINTLPTALFKRIAPTLKMGIDRPPPLFLGVIRLALVLKRSLSPFYVTNLIDRGFPFTGIIEVSELTKPDEMHGHKLVMLPRYDVPDSPWFEKSDTEITQAFLEKIFPLWPDLNENIIRTFVHRERIVQALWIDQPPPNSTPPRNDDQRVWSINAELAGRDTLNNNALIRVIDHSVETFIRESQ